MIRNTSFEEISDGNKYKADELAKVNCGGCVNCSDCCKMYETILLDPYDVFQLENNLSKSFEELLLDDIELGVHEGIILPNLKGNPETGKCHFLKNDRCTVHSFRPGFCRLFPLGRIYEGDDFDYFVQVHECPYPNKTKIRIKNWLEIENLPAYEEYIRSWHHIEKGLRVSLKGSDAETSRKINFGFLKLFYYTPYNTELSFFEQFASRAKALE